MVGIVLAFQTRKVKLRSLKDSKYIATIIYISSISIVVMALVTFALKNYINIGTGILAFGIFILTTVFLALIFVPKVRVICNFSFILYIDADIIIMQMVLLYKDPHGKDSGVVNSQTEGTLNRFTSNNIQNNKCEELEKKVSLLEKVVLDKDKIIVELRNEVDSAKCSNDQTHRQV